MKTTQYILNVDTTEAQRLDAFRLLMKTFVFLVRGAKRQNVELGLTGADLVMWPHDATKVVEGRKLIISSRNKALKIMEAVQKRFEKALMDADIGFRKEVMV